MSERSQAPISVYIGVNGTHRPDRDHDRSYRLLFSHPEMVEALLRGLVGEPWTEGLDFTSLEQCTGSYLSEGLDERRQDLLWKVSFRGCPLYVYLLMEHQSRSDRQMALRMLVYVGLLYQDLLRRGEVRPGQKLPPVLPLVLYNGERPWTAATDLLDLVEVPHPGLERYAPRLRYLLLDVGRLRAAELAAWRDPVAALFEVERARRPEELTAAVERLMAAVEAARPELKRATDIWLREALRQFWLETGGAEDRNMISERMLRWERQFEERGRQKGWRAGRKKGRQEGRQEGEAALLLRLVERKFGPVEPESRQRIETASAEDLLLWGERLLTAERAEELFEEQS